MPGGVTGKAREGIPVSIQLQGRKAAIAGWIVGWIMLDARVLDLVDLLWQYL